MSQQINLFNPEFAKKRDLLSLSGLVSACGLALLVVMVAVVASAAHNSSLESRLAMESAARDTAQAEMGRLATQLGARKADAQLAAEVARLESGLASRKEVMNTLHAGVIGDTQGFSAYLEAFARQSFSGLWLTGLKVAGAGHDVVLEGRALQPELLAGYLKRLNGENVMQGHAFAELEMLRPEATDKDKQKAKPDYIAFRLSTLPLAESTQSQTDK